MTTSLAVVTGGGGFIGGHLVASLRQRGHRIRVVDIMPTSQWHQHFPDVDNVVADLQCADACAEAVKGASVVYQLASDMGGMGFIERNKARCMLSVLIDAQMLKAAAAAGVERFFYSSSACVYNVDKQRDERAAALKESDAYPAMPEDGYGWEKLFAEQMCRQFREDFGLATRVARYHNIYGPRGTWEGGREKAPAAICRKVIEAIADNSHTIEIWGPGTQTRSFTYIDDCVKGTQLIAENDIIGPVNLGSNELVTINHLVDIVESIAGVRLTRTYDLSAPKGVNGRNSDNALILDTLGWQPSIRLHEGMEQTYRWIYDEFSAKYGKPR